MKKKLLRIVLAAVLLPVAYLLTEKLHMSMPARLAVYLIPYLIVAYDVLAEAIEGITKGELFDENFLMTLATVGAMSIGFLPGAEPQFTEGVFVMLFFQIGELFEHYAEEKSRKSITGLMDLRPDTATVLRDGESEVVEPQQVQVGETLLVKPGEKIPLDGVVTAGQSSLNTVALTGESLPRDVTEGDEVASGCVNLSGVLTIRSTRSFSESTASRIIRLIEESSEGKSKNETFIRKFARIYTPVVVFLSVAIAFIPPLFADSYGESFPSWLYRALTFLVVSCPCALVVSIPLTFFAGIGGASRKGILIKGGNLMDMLAHLSVVVFDKTGTLTKGVFAVDAVHPEQLGETELLRLAAQVERLSNHPIAAALCQAYPDRDAKCTITQVEDIAGHGIRALVDGKIVCVGNEKLMELSGVKTTRCNRCISQAGTVVHIATDGIYAGHIVISDQMKEDASDAVGQLKHMGVKKTVMLTGDRKEVGNVVASKLKIDEAHSGLLPADKVAHVKRLLATRPANTYLAFVGDGVNDAPVLAMADVGIAMGAMGSDAAIEAADVVLMDDKPSRLIQAICIARRTIRIAGQNAWFAIGTKVGILILVATGILGSWAMDAAVFGDVGVMFLAVVNAMRAMGGHKNSPSIPQP